MSTSQRRLGNYRLQERLVGAQLLTPSTVEVWKGFDTQQNRPVVLKIFHPDLRSQPDFMADFQREAQSISSLHHSGIVQLLDAQVIDAPESGNTVAYLVTEYIEGSTLASYIERTSATGNFPPIPAILHLFTVIGKAIDAAHQQGIVHRDLKPTNILFDLVSTAPGTRPGPGIPKVADFGIATITRTLSSSEPRNSVYSSPEQIQGAIGDERSDIYALGVMLYQICTGSLPFKGDSPSSSMLQRLHDTPIPPALLHPNIPPAVTVVLLKCLARNPMIRFATASSLVAALAEAFNIAPVELETNTMDEPTYRMALGDEGPTYRIPPSGSSSSSPINSPVTPVFLSSTVAPMPTPVGAQPIAPPAPPPAKKKRRKVLLALIPLLIILLLGSGLGLFFLLSHRPAVAAPAIVGHAVFLSSGQIRNNSTQGINDGLIIDLHNIQPPVAGHTYYAWLLGDKQSGTVAPLLLGPLTITKGNVHLPYTNPQHTNLLAITSRFLITEQPTTATPTPPSTDISTWRYYAELAQTVASDSGNGSTKPFSLLDHLRHLLSDDPKLLTANFHGGLATWLSNNIEQVFTSAQAARDDWETLKQSPNRVCLIRDQFIRILDYLDGPVHVLSDIPASSIQTTCSTDPLLIDAKVALLPLSPQDASLAIPPYLLHIGTHLASLLATPGVNETQKKLVPTITKEMDSVMAWLKQVRQYAIQLEAMTDTQLHLSDALTKMDEMTSNALAAYSGQLAPDTNQIQGGAAQIVYDIQQLATFDISAYPQK